MMDRYTKAVLTVIAVSLVALVGQNAMKSASAQQGCGESRFNACYVQTDLLHPLTVQIR